MWKKVVCCTGLIVLLLGGQVFAEEVKETKVKAIDGYRGFKWGTSMEEFQKEMKGVELELDSTETDDGGTCYFIDMEGMVGGYEAYAGFCFDENGLVGGAYELEIEENEWEDMLDKYIQVYGEPTSLRKGDEPAVVWIDAEQNIICMTGEEIFYAQHDSVMLEIITGLRREVEKVGNLEGI